MTRGKYGRRPNDPARPRIRLARSLTGAVPAYPAAADWLASLHAWQMLGNDQYGDCVAVTWSNLRRLTTATLTSEFYPPLAQVEALYKTQNPRFPADDNGMDIQTALGYLVSHGGPDGVKALGFAAVDYTSPAEVKAAIAIFGAVWVGFDVTAANEDEFDAGQPWDYMSGSPDVGGHSVLAGGYGGPLGAGQLGGDEKFITWAEETSFTDRMWGKQVSECWAVIWPEHLLSREFLAGVDVAQFAADYTAITGKPFPADVPPGPVPPSPGPGPAPVPPAPVPVPGPDAADAALIAAGDHWAAERHTGDNERMKVAYLAWRKAKEGS
jgi:hypothetical protein